ncbi:hypothetical protein H112_01882 [Trichophyton rubrum D6]|uniref:Uncharacterized protein n=3 Tax=Trichophyton TaxID=5550 RepID=A0A080WNJ7_TRIRC|nr:uncharacterized protein TERG_12436 [Trichophyton rubrum CBS 118892]EZF25868.1 hypothetical protein H100_01878 [Trichophyton rubrum MR850]EZF44844.1 hypothetical protein H102_01876 [Trichophyton rubrum CBS 100081]EZF55496.1 hypothetical protein H103_01886 [Trichophyton rubrum CBS 288.86]EZF66077.1 hypothetical protein H104_01862 [Trichophyton rubrum CBS 289.86]EZF76698.1 hypothetical protein H105_01892 [Trichophyton soudanense CBS 452.61]EZF87530.1 hypothetical protein H110_01884 [Trichophy
MNMQCLRIATGELCIVYRGLRIFIHDGGFPIGTGSSNIAFSGLPAPLNSMSKLKSGSNTRATQPYTCWVQEYRRRHWFLYPSTLAHADAGNIDPRRRYPIPPRRSQQYGQLPVHFCKRHFLEAIRKMFW